MLIPFQTYHFFKTKTTFSSETLQFLYFKMQLVLKFDDYFHVTQQKRLLVLIEQ